MVSCVQLKRFQAKYPKIDSTRDGLFSFDINYIAMHIISKMKYIYIYIYIYI